MREPTANLQYTTLLVEENLQLSVPNNLDFTHQILDFYDPHEPVLAIWDGDQLAYFVVFQKLPQGWLDGRKWISGYKRSIKAVSKFFSFKTISEGELQTESPDYSLMHCEVEYTERGEASQSQQIVYFIANNESSYTAIATPVRVSTKAIREHLDSIIGTVENAPNVTQLRSSKPSLQYAGLWRGEYINRYDEPIEILLELKEDTTLTLCERIPDENISSAYTGAWYVQQEAIHCTFMFSKPHSDHFKRYEKAALVIDENDRLIMAEEDNAQVLFYKLK